MAESLIHMHLVEHLYFWTKDNLFGGDDGNILVSLPETPTHSKPRRVLYGYEPDLLAKDLRTNTLIIGEAKTAEDIARQHSKEQYRAYFETCKYHPGPSIVLFAVPYFEVSRMRAIIKSSCGPFCENIRFEVLGFISCEV